MKNIIILLCIFISFSALAQDPQLFENTWYLQKLTIDTLEILPPDNNPENTEHTFDESGSGFLTGYCDFLGCDITFDNSNDSFNINSIVAFGPGCVHPDDVAFHAIYTDYLHEYQNFNPYFFEITNDNDIIFLEFTNANGNKALYSNQLLAVNEQELVAVSVFPNPVINELKIASKTVIEYISIYNITGQLVKQMAPVSNNSTINLEELVSGVYFVKLTTEEGAVSTRKIIKE